MSSESESSVELAKKIEATEKKIRHLDRELESIGKLAARDLKHRLAALRIEEHALKRNFAELSNSYPPDGKKRRKVETLLHHIEAEEEELEHEAEIRSRGNSKSPEALFRSLSRFFNRDRFRRKRN
jgi:predicted RNase H-like nuclease (RuvC/YqgF family)